MKAEIISKNNGKAVIELTINTDRELCDLYHRANVSADTVNNAVGGLVYEADTSACDSLYNRLLELVLERNLTE